MMEMNYKVIQSLLSFSECREGASVGGWAGGYDKERIRITFRPPLQMIEQSGVEDLRDADNRL